PIGRNTQICARGTTSATGRTSTGGGSVPAPTPTSAAAGSGTSNTPGPMPRRWAREACPSRKQKTSRSEEHTSELQSRFDLVCRLPCLLFPYTTLFRSLQLGETPRSALAAQPRLLAEHRLVGDRSRRPLPHRRQPVLERQTPPALCRAGGRGKPAHRGNRRPQDRKSTRLNSSHVSISYAVFLAYSFPTRRSSDLSNWAKHPDLRSRHNLGYWQNIDWWGIGPGAHSHIGGSRFWNVKHPRPYAAQVGAGSLPIAETEDL